MRSEAGNAIRSIQQKEIRSTKFVAGYPDEILDRVALERAMGSVAISPGEFFNTMSNVWRY